MMSASTKGLMVDTQGFVDAATRDRWGYGAAVLLMKEMCPEAEWPATLPPGDLARLTELAGLPARLRYDDLAPRLGGRQRLAAIEALVGVDVRLAGGVLLAMAGRLFMPHVPLEHIARQPTADLLDAFEGWVMHGKPGDHYVGEAFRYRSRFGTTRTSAGTDEEYQYLFEAMPSEGLCRVLGEGLWGLAGHWCSFGRHLARRSEEWAVLDDVDDRIDETIFVADHEGLPAVGHDAEATEAARGIVDSMRESCIDVILEDGDDALDDLLDEVLPELCERFGTLERARDEAARKIKPLKSVMGEQE
jgi:hypothetical protein